MEIENDDEEEIVSTNQAVPRYDYQTFIGVNLPIRMVDKIRDFQRRYRMRTKTQAYQQVIDLGLFVESKLGLVNSIKNEELEELKEQIENRQVVDYVAKMDMERFRVLVDIMKDEQETRQRNDKQIKWKK